MGGALKLFVLAKEVILNLVAWAVRVIANRVPERTRYRPTEINTSPYCYALGDCGTYASENLLDA